MTVAQQRVELPRSVMASIAAITVYEPMAPVERLEGVSR